MTKIPALIPKEGQSGGEVLFEDQVVLDTILEELKV